MTSPQSKSDTTLPLPAFGVQFHGLRLVLHCADERARAHWRTLFDGFPQDEAAETAVAETAVAETAVAETAVAETAVAEPDAADLCFVIRTRDALPSLPAFPPYFQTPHHDPHAPRPNVAAYRLRDGRVLLAFHDGAQVALPLGQPAGNVIPVEAVITPAIFRRGRVEDVIMAALAALLRPRGYFLLHAFAAVRDGAATLLVGQSGSGKTTTGLNLLRRGWHYLANDLTLLQQRADGVYALPSPGGFSIQPSSLRLLPWLQPLARKWPLNGDDGKYHMPASILITHRAPPSPIRALYFPQVSHSPTSRLHPLKPALALAHLMSESIDSWDEPTLDAHVSLLQALSQQAPAATLHLGYNTEEIAALIVDGC